MTPTPASIEAETSGGLREELALRERAERRLMGRRGRKEEEKAGDLAAEEKGLVVGMVA